MQYDIFIHRHKFAVWAAARAVQRGWKEAKVVALRIAIENSGIKEFLADQASLNINSEQFEQLHRNWCSGVCSCLNNAGITTSYGRAAKLIGIYLKSMVVVGGYENTNLAKFAHPPVDRILLQNISRIKNMNFLRAVNWTQLESKEYYSLIALLRKIVTNEQPFWKIEEYWTITND